MPAAQSSAQSAHYAIDLSHSSVTFGIRHIVYTVHGKFALFNGSITVDSQNPTTNAAEATIEVESIDTGIKLRDSTLKSPDYFDATKYPEIKFRSKGWKEFDDGSYDVTGDLTIKGVTREITLRARRRDPDAGPGANGRYHWEVRGVLNRQDFGIASSSVLDKPIGDKVTVTILIEADRL